MHRNLNLLNNRRTTWAGVVLAIAVALWLPASAAADIVSGRIFGLDEKPIVSGSFVAKNAKGETTTFKSDKTGNFSVYLDPGKYTVSSTTDATLTGTIDSAPQPKQLDVHLKKAEGK